MTDRTASARQNSRQPSSAFATPSHSNDSSSVRPRNRRYISSEQDVTSDLLSPAVTPVERESSAVRGSSAHASRDASPSLFQRPRLTPRHVESEGNLGQFLSESWAQSWSSIQGFTSSILQDAKSDRSRSPAGRLPGNTRPGVLSRQVSNNSARGSSAAWGPEPVTSAPKLQDVAAGSKARREAALKAARTASVLESHDGVNGGLDVTGRHKRRNSDDVSTERPPPEDFLAYIHHVQPSDSYVGLILRYKCREDAFKKANGLWSRDAVQARKWLLVPVDTCEIRGRPCEPPSWYNDNGVDLLAPTPGAAQEEARDGIGHQSAHDDFFSRPVNGDQMTPRQPVEDDKPWVHARWVQVEGFGQPIQIGRVSRQATGYFPPRRRKSIRSMSNLSTPRQSTDLSSIAPGSVEGPASRRVSTSSNRPNVLGTPVSTRSRGGSEGADDRPAWMRRPGGVGSMSRNVRAPGPANDYFNSWTTKHIPGLNMNGLPSMSIMGSEVARFGFNGKESSPLVESAADDGRDATMTPKQGNGLDKAAMAVETWLRGALARRPSTPLVSGRAKSGRAFGDPDGDLIELTDTASDDGRSPPDGSGLAIFNAMPPTSVSGRSDAAGAVRGRSVGTGSSKAGKAD